MIPSVSSLPEPRVLCVGIDGSDASWDALRWASSEATDTGCALLVAHIGEADASCDFGHELLADAVARLADDHPTLRVHTELAAGDSAGMLIKLSERSALLVVGRGGAPYAAPLTGATARAVLAHAACPVAVVPCISTGHRTGRRASRAAVVTGASLAPAGLAALRFAAREARRRAVVLHGVRSFAGLGDEDTRRSSAQVELESWLTLARREFPDVVVRGELSGAPVTRALARTAADAELLVIGHHRQGARGRPRVGRVAGWATRRAPCPVIIVSDDEVAEHPADAPAAAPMHPPAGGYPSGSALCTDGTFVEIRHATTHDREALQALDAAASPRSIHYRFFTGNRAVAAQYTAAVSAEPQSDRRETLVACVGDAVVGLATLEITDERTGELALLVADATQHEGIGTILLEELIHAARRRGLRVVVADVLCANSAMTHVLRDLGLSIAHDIADGVVHEVIDLDDRTGFEEAVTAREQRAETASLRPLLAPRSIAVIGVGRRENSVGRAVLRNLLDSGFTGEVSVVHPEHASILGVPAVRTALDLPTAVELAVIAVPVAEVLHVVDDCGRRGVGAALLLSAGFGETGAEGRAAQRAVLASARRSGMRLVGPNCLGVVNTDPLVRLNATFAPMPLLRGGLALASQSGAVGIAVIHAAAARGLGVAQFVSMGNKADVSGNDLLLTWAGDDAVSVIGLYLESLGNPRKFVRIARSVTRTKPVLALKAGRGAVGQRAGMSHTAAAAAAEPVMDALFAQAGVQRVDTMEQLLDAVRVIDSQPRPCGPRVAIIGNSGGPEIMTADAAEGTGLEIVELSPLLREHLRALVPSIAGDANPVDLGAAAQPSEVRAVLDAVIASGEVDGVLTVFVETLASSPADTRAAVIAAAADAALPVVATEVGSEPSSVAFADDARALPVFGFPEAAVGALAVAVRAASVQRGSPRHSPLPPTGIDAMGVQRMLGSLLAGGDRWLQPDEAVPLLRACGIPLSEQLIARGEDAVSAAARELGYPVVVKAAHGVHKSDSGGVVVDVRDDAGVRAACAALGDIEVVIQPMHSGGTEIIVGAVQDPQFGPIVMAGPGGVLTGLAGGHTLRLAPVTDADVDAMLAAAPMPQLLAGFRGKPPVSRAAVADVVHRVTWLIDHCPAIAELDLNPLICTGDRVVAVDVKVRVASRPSSPDPTSRMLSTVLRG